jgi:YrbI family 3-deoxy-D-manno-octulosonate 8-phosphate phosphatase
MPPSVWAVIPARGGSRGIPRKNLEKVGGLSLLHRTIAAAQSTRAVERVIVSTDDAEIAAHARRAGADVVMRPAELANDTASSESALLHVLDSEEARSGKTPNILLFLQCTSPFIRSEDIAGLLERLDSQRADSALLVCPSHGFLWKSPDDATGVNHDKAVRLRRQDLAPEYLETGAGYAMRTEGFRATQHRFFGKTVLHEMPSARALEIDTPDDLARARAMAPRLETDPRWPLPIPLAGIVFDFDGVMTDDRVTVGQDGYESVTCHRGDGLGIERARKAGLNIVVLSKETNPVVKARCEKLKIASFQGIDDKLTSFRAIAANAKAGLQDFIYVGNDVNDLECIKTAGLGVAVADAHASVLTEADLVLSRRGGHGAVRELLDGVLNTLSRS